MKLGALVGGLIGLGLVAWLLSSYGAVRVLEVLGRAGFFGFVAVVAFHVPQMLLSALGWEAIARPGPGLRTYLTLRWVREGVNNLLPLAQIGGEFVVARLLQQQGVRLARAIGGTIADLLLEVSTQVLFTVLGVALLVHVSGHSQVSEFATRALGIAVLVVGGAFAALWMGLAGVIERAALRMGRSLGWPATAEIDGLHQGLVGCFRVPWRVVLGCFWHLASWLSGGLEVCLILHFLGTEIDLETGLIIESLGQALKAMGFAVPAGLGVQEGGYVVVCRLLNIPPQTALAVSLIKRVREAVLGIPGLILWHRAEAKASGAPAASL